MLVTLTLLSLATLGTWDILRLLLPTRVPQVIGKLSCVLIPWLLLKYAPDPILLPLCVPGVFLLINRVISPDQHTPWGPALAELVRVARRRRTDAPSAQPPPRIGNRIRPL